MKILDKFKSREAVIILVLLVISIFFHVYNINNNLIFWADQGSHLQAIKDIWINKSFTVAGPPTSFFYSAGLTHSAFVYYLYLLPAIISNYNALLFSFFFIILSVLSLPLLYYTTKEVYNKKVAYIATIIYTVSYGVILFGRFYWNMNAVPFFTILSIFTLTKYLKGGNKYYLPLFIFTTSVLSQFHLTLIFVFLPSLLILLPNLRKINKEKKLWLINFIVFLIPWITTIIQQIQYMFPIVTYTLKNILRNKSNPSIGKLGELLNLYNRLIDNMQVTTQIEGMLGVIIILIGIIIITKYAIKYKDNLHRNVNIYILTMILTTIIILTVDTVDYHVGMTEHFFILLPIVIGIFIDEILFAKKELIIIGVVLISYILVSSIYQDYEYILKAPNYYKTQNDICKSIKANGLDQNYSITIKAPYNTTILSTSIWTHNNDTNVDNSPTGIFYICSSNYHITNNPDSNSKHYYYIETDYRNKLSIKTYPK